jgi:hypothetical protein
MLGEASFSMVSEDLEKAKIIYIYIYRLDVQQVVVVVQLAR